MTTKNKIIGTRHKFNALGESADKNKQDYVYTNPDTAILEYFDFPMMEHGDFSINIECPEFTSICPITGQPDTGKIIINYIPNLRCVESKALKLYLMRFRNTGMFHEQCVRKIYTDLFTVLKPIYLGVKGEFAARGGISIHPFMETFN